ncbi:hypothetical protein [Polluticaenibacter yanchengensis]|uniref:Uncharacterized protein n=1 Tax=Polluticaenibacter yanchengensis TaxID=3014562 RepID=A0ABT4UKK4_9BACT|nr:hypothetical protein [Chitinophagaceae bacterium LY-5]
MKTKIIKGKVEILLVDELPKGINHVGVLGQRILVTNKDGGFATNKCVEPGNWQFLSTIDDLTEEQAGQILGLDLCACCSLEKKGIYGVNGGFVAGCEGSRCDDSREELLIKFDDFLATNDVLTENPFGKKPYFPEQGSYDVHMMDAPTFRALKSQFDKWHEAEAKVFNPKTTLIFIKQ